MSSESEDSFITHWLDNDDECFEIIDLIFLTEFSDNIMNLEVFYWTDFFSIYLFFSENLMIFWHLISWNFNSDFAFYQSFDFIFHDNFSLYLIQWFSDFIVDLWFLKICWFWFSDCLTTWFHVSSCKSDFCLNFSKMLRWHKMTVKRRKSRFVRNVCMKKIHQFICFIMTDILDLFLQFSNLILMLSNTNIWVLLMCRIEILNIWSLDSYRYICFMFSLINVQFWACVWKRALCHNWIFALYRALWWHCFKVLLNKKKFKFLLSKWFFLWFLCWLIKDYILRIDNLIQMNLV